MGFKVKPMRSFGSHRNQTAHSVRQSYAKKPQGKVVLSFDEYLNGDFLTTTNTQQIIVKGSCGSMVIEGDELLDTTLRHTQHNKRFNKMLELSSKFTDEGYGHTLANVLMESSSVELNENIVNLFNRPNSDVWKPNLMSESERQFLANLPETITMYRGYTREDTRMGWSWSTELDVALYFSCREVQKGRFNGDGTPHSEYFENGHYLVAKCNKNDVIAFFGRHGERNIFIDPQFVTILSEHNTPKDYDQWTGRTFMDNDMYKWMN